MVQRLNSPTAHLAILSITASEAAVERSFSRQGIIHSDRRNRSSEASVYHQMCVSFNLRALERSELTAEQRLDRGVTEELPDTEKTDATPLLSERENLVAAELTFPPSAAVEEKAENLGADLLIDEQEPVLSSDASSKTR